MWTRVLDQGDKGRGSGALGDTRKREGKLEWKGVNFQWSLIKERERGRETEKETKTKTETETENR